MKLGWTKRPPPEPEEEEKSAERTRLYSSPIIYVSLRSRSPGLKCLSRVRVCSGLVPPRCAVGSTLRQPRDPPACAAPSREVTPSLNRHRSSRARRLRQLLPPTPKKWLSPAKAVPVSIQFNCEGVS